MSGRPELSQKANGIHLSPVRLPRIALYILLGLNMGSGFADDIIETNSFNHRPKNTIGG